MKNFLFLTIAFFSFQFVDAQEQISQPTDAIYNYKDVDVKPDFPNGIGDFYQFIAKNYVFPNVKKLRGKVFVAFIIEKDGSIGEVVILRDLGCGTGEEAIRVLKKSPKWIPAQLKGEKVRCRFNLPISLQS
ncbi:MAG: energy transducer TonB [Flavobacteriaceae bacterium]|nr:energy transducer TonB [Flavobacteriaceae bacterium]